MIDKKEKISKKANSYDLSYYVDSVKNNLSWEKTLSLIDTLRSCVCWIVALDYYHETNDVDYLRLAEDNRKTLYSFLTYDQIKDFETYTSLIIKPYFEYEKQIEEKIFNSEYFNSAEIDEFMWKRSSDSILYSKLTNYYKKIPNSLVSLFHFRQYVEDIEDCIDDYDEDLKNKEANIFFMVMLMQGITPDNFPKQFDGSIDSTLIKEKAIHHLHGFGKVKGLKPYTHVKNRIIEEIEAMLY